MPRRAAGSLPPPARPPTAASAPPPPTAGSRRRRTAKLRRNRASAARETSPHPLDGRLLSAPQQQETRTRAENNCEEMDDTKLAGGSRQLSEKVDHTLMRCHTQLYRARPALFSLLLLQPSHHRRHSHGWMSSTDRPMDETEYRGTWFEGTDSSTSAVNGCACHSERMLVPTPLTLAYSSDQSASASTALPPIRTGRETLGGSGSRARWKAERRRGGLGEVGGSGISVGCGGEWKQGNRRHGHRGVWRAGARRRGAGSKAGQGSVERLYKWMIYSKGSSRSKNKRRNGGK